MCIRDRIGTNSNIANFYSLGASVRMLNLTNTILTLTGTVWNVTPTNFNLIHTNGRISLSNAATSVFTGGGKNYNELRLNAGAVTLVNSNHFNLVESIPSGNTININNGDTLSVDSLITLGTCSNKTQLKASSAIGPVARFIKTGYSVFSGAFLSVNRVQTIVAPSQVYQLKLSDTANLSGGWNYQGSKFFWIGNAGNYSSSTHWSLTSGGGLRHAFPEK